MQNIFAVIIMTMGANMLMARNIPVVKNPEKSFANRPTGTEGRSEVTGVMPMDDEFAQIALQLADLERNLDALSSDIIKAKQSIFEQAHFDNSIKIEIDIKNSKSVALQNIDVSLDNVALYDFNAGDNLWIPTEVIPIYHGPLSQGAHRLDLTMHVLVRGPGQFDFKNSQYKLINSSFRIDIPEGPFKKTWVVVVDGSPSDIKNISAQLTETELRDP